MAASLRQEWSWDSQESHAAESEYARERAAAPVNTRAVRVVRREAASRDAVTLWLAEPGTALAPAPYLPGQFVTLAVPVGDELLYRSYSLCGSGRADAPWEITVKRAGAASNALCERVGPGATLYSSPPRGTFTLPRRLDPRRPLIFVAGGSGITPIAGMLRTLADLPAVMRPRVQLHYASRMPEETIFGRELARLDPEGEWLRRWHYFSKRGQRMTPEAVQERVGAWAARAEWYICAPETLKRDMLLMLHDEDVPLSRVHLEVFASPKRRALALSMPLTMKFVEAAAPVVAIEGRRNTLDVRPDESLLETLERHGYRPKFGCRAGVCGVCRMRVLSGRVTDDCDSVLSAQERAAGYVLGCTAQPLGSVMLAASSVPAMAPISPLAPREAVAPRGSSRRRAPGRGGKMMLRLATLAATVGIFCGAWVLTSAAPSARSAYTTGAPASMHMTAPAPSAPRLSGGATRPAMDPIYHWGVVGGATEMQGRFDAWRIVR